MAILQVHKCITSKTGNAIKCKYVQTPFMNTSCNTNQYKKSKKCNKKRRPGVVVSTNTLPPKYILDIN